MTLIRRWSEGATTCAPLFRHGCSSTGGETMSSGQEMGPLRLTASVGRRILGDGPSIPLGGPSRPPISTSQGAPM